MNDLFNPTSESTKKLSIHEQIAEVERELSERESVYPKMIVSGMMTRAKADKHITAMRAVRESLAWIRENEAAIREVVRKA